MNEFAVRFEYHEGNISFQGPDARYFPNSSWRVRVDDIVAVGGVSRSISDRDEFSIVFIMKDLTLYPVNCSRYEFHGFEVFVRFLHEKFNIDGGKYARYISDEAIVLFPGSLKGKPLYKPSFWHSVKKILDINHYATGELSDEVAAFVKNS